MTNYRSYILLLSLNLIFLFSYSQGVDTKDDLIKKVESVIKEIDSTSGRFEYKKRLSNRKLVINGWIGKTNKSFRQEIKYYKSGLKKEETKFYSNEPAGKILIMYAIRINDNFHYIEYYEDVKENNNILKKEVLIDNRFYQNTQTIK